MADSCIETTELPPFALATGLAVEWLVAGPSPELPGGEAGKACADRHCCDADERDRYTPEEHRSVRFTCLLNDDVPEVPLEGSQANDESDGGNCCSSIGPESVLGHRIVGRAGRSDPGT